jgi:transcriptional regulator with XRE-family HTH domain
MSRSEPADPALAEAIRVLRERSGETQEEIAYRARISIGHLSRVEGALANPSWTVVGRIAAALQVDLRGLLDVIDELHG